MRSYLRIKGKRLWSVCAIVLIGVVIANCNYYVDSITQPASAKANETIKVNVKTHIFANGNDAPPTAMIFGVLAPRGWDLKNNANISIKYSGTLIDGELSMTRVPEDALAKNGNGLTWQEAFKKQYGAGGNFIDDLEWTVFQTQDVVYLNNTDIYGDINITMKVGADNNNAKVTLVYAYTDSQHGFIIDGPGGFNTAGYFASDSYRCFEVTDGSSGETIDYCNPQLSTTAPAKITTDDFLTFNYNSNLNPGPLTKNPEIYLSAIGYDENDNELAYAVTENAVLKPNDIATTYTGSILPSQYFVIPAGKALKRISYYYTNSKSLVREPDEVKVGRLKDPFEEFGYIVKCD